MMWRTVCPCVFSRAVKTILLLCLLLAGFVPGAWSQADVVGQWSTLSYTMPINPVHVALLNNGKVVIVSGSGNVPGTRLIRRRCGILKPVRFRPSLWLGTCSATA